MYPIEPGRVKWPAGHRYAHRMDPLTLVTRCGRNAEQLPVGRVDAPMCSMCAYLDGPSIPSQCLVRDAEFFGGPLDGHVLTLNRLFESAEAAWVDVAWPPVADAAADPDAPIGVVRYRLESAADPRRWVFVR